MTRMELHRSEMRNLNPDPEPDQSPIMIPEGPKEADTVGANGRGAGAGARAGSREKMRKIPIPHRLSRNHLMFLIQMSRLVRRIIPSLRGREDGGKGRKGGRERRGRKRSNGGEGRRRRRRGEGKSEKRKEERNTKRRRKKEIRKRAKKGLSQIHGASMGSSEKLICGISSSLQFFIFPNLRFFPFFLYNVLILLRIQCYVLYRCRNC